MALRRLLPLSGVALVVVAVVGVLTTDSRS
jgi:hypothetical protein